MGMFTRIKRGLALTKDSIIVMKNHPKLLAFPLIAGVSAIVFLGVLALVSLGLLDVLVDLPQEGVVLGALFVVYFVTTFISSFFTGALVHETKEIIEGGEPDLRRGMEAAWRVRKKLAAWAAVSATVGVVLRVLESSDSRAARIVSLIVGVAWTLVTFFVIPTAVLKPETSVRDMFTESGRTFKQLWGETPIGIVGPNLVAIPFYLLGVAVAFAFVGVSVVAAVLGFLVFAVLGMLVASGLRGVLKTALYVYAVEGKLPREFEGEDIEGLAESKPSGAAGGTGGMGGMGGAGGRGGI